MMFSRTQQVPFFYNQSIHRFFFFLQSYNFLMDALEGYRIHRNQNNVSKGTRLTIGIRKIILIIIEILVKLLYYSISHSSFCCK